MEVKLIIFSNSIHPQGNKFCPDELIGFWTLEFWRLSLSLSKRREIKKILSYGNNYHNHSVAREGEDKKKKKIYCGGDEEDEAATLIGTDAPTSGLLLSFSPSSCIKMHLRGSLNSCSYSSCSWLCLMRCWLALRLYYSGFLLLWTAITHHHHHRHHNLN